MKVSPRTIHVCFLYDLSGVSTLSWPWTRSPIGATCPHQCLEPTVYFLSPSLTEALPWHWTGFLAHGLDTAPSICMAEVCGITIMVVPVSISARHLCLQISVPDMVNPM